MTTSDEAPDDSRHCSPEELRRIADDANGASAEALSHVDSCAACRAAVDALRQSRAREALASAPPSDLFDRIKARRAAGERVALPVDEIDDDVAIARDGHPSLLDVHRVADGELDAARDAALVAHVRACAQCSREVEDAWRVNALLSLTSRAPADLFERTAARRAAGERVLLPIEPLTGNATNAKGATVDVARSRRRIAPSWVLAIAAMLLLGFGLSRVLTSRAPAVVAVDSAKLPVAGSREDSILLRGQTSAALRAGELRAAVAALDATIFALDTTAADTIRLGVRDAAFTDGSLSARARDAMRVLGDALATRFDVRVAIVGNADATMTDGRIAALTARMRILRDALATVGRTADTAFVRTPAPARAERVELLLLAPKTRPELR